MKLAVFLLPVFRQAGKKAPDDLRNTLYVFDYNSLTVAHLGDLNRVPTQAEIEALGR